MERADVLIVGGGPAGSACAAALVAEGRDALVLDAAVFPRDKPCAGWITPEVVAGVDSCANCNMVIDEVNQAAGWIQGREFVTFDSPGCLLARYEVLRKGGEPLPEALYFADYQDGSFHSAATATFLLTSHRPTVMGSGALTFSSRGRASRVLPSMPTSPQPKMNKVGIPIVGIELPWAHQGHWRW